MSDFQTHFDNAIWQVVNTISIGRVMAYGEVARAAGYPRHARMVSRSMARSPNPLPWHRVVKSNRTLAFDVGSDNYIKQEQRLLNEGVKIVQGKIIPCLSDKDRDLDEILWGTH